MAKYRFYYSAQQEATMSGLGVGRTWIVLSNTQNRCDEIAYTQLCSLPDDFPNWEDAILVYESEELPQVRHEWTEEEKEDWDRLIQEVEDAYTKESESLFEEFEEEDK